MRKSFCKTLFAVMIVVAMLFAMCAISYADTAIVQANDEGSPALQTDIISVMPMTVKEVRINPMLLYNDTSTVYEHIDPGVCSEIANTYGMALNPKILHIEPGK